MVQHEAVVLDALACFGQNWPNRTDLFGVPETQDYTGMLDMNDGGHGKLLPENASPFILEALSLAGLRNADLRTENFALMEKVAMFGSGSVSNRVTNGFSNTQITYIIRGSFSAGDMNAGNTLDARVAGFGPFFDSQGITITTHMFLLDPYNTFENLVPAPALRQHISYAALGFNVGTVTDGKLVTAGMSVSDQQNLQFGAARLSMFIHTLSAISRLPQAPQVCKEKVEAILASR